MILIFFLDFKTFTISNFHMTYIRYREHSLSRTFPRTFSSVPWEFKITSVDCICFVRKKKKRFWFCPLKIVGVRFHLKKLLIYGSGNRCVVNICRVCNGEWKVNFLVLFLVRKLLFCSSLHGIVYFHEDFSQSAFRSSRRAIFLKYLFFFSF